MVKYSQLDTASDSERTRLDMSVVQYYCLIPQLRRHLHKHDGACVRMGECNLRRAP